MADFFKAWVMLLAAIIIFGSMCEMILPDGAYKKYVHLAIGLMLIMSVLKPIVKNEVDITAEIPVGDSWDVRRDEGENRAAVSRVYKAKLEERVSGEPGFEKAKVECDICRDEEFFGRIDKMRITATEVIEPEYINAVMMKYNLTEDKIEIKYNDQGDKYGS